MHWNGTAAEQNVCARTVSDYNALALAAPIKPADVVSVGCTNTPGHTHYPLLAPASRCDAMTLAANVLFLFSCAAGTHTHTRDSVGPVPGADFRALLCRRQHHHHHQHPQRTDRIGIGSTRSGNGGRQLAFRPLTVCSGCGVIIRE